MSRCRIPAVLALVVCAATGASTARAADAPIPTSVVISAAIENFVAGSMEVLDPPPGGDCGAPDAPGYYDAIGAPITADVFCPPGQSAAGCILLEYQNYLQDLQDINEEYKEQYCLCVCCWEEDGYESVKDCHSANAERASWDLFIRMLEYMAWQPPAYCCAAAK